MRRRNKDKQMKVLSTKAVRAWQRQKAAAGGAAAAAAAAAGGEETAGEAAAGGEETPGPEAPASPDPFAMEPDEAAASGEPAPEVKIEPLSSPEPEFVEQDEAVPWPEAGVQVAVGVEHLLHSLRVGDTGISEGPVPEDPSEVLLKLDSVAVLKSVRIPRSLLVPVGAPMKSMRWWDKCSESLKREILLKVGVRDPRDEVLTDTPGPF